MQTILVSGASGLVGSALCEALRARGHRVRTLSRSKGDVLWDVEAGQLEAGALDGVDVVVHLAGEAVAQRWTRVVKGRILESRVKSTQLLVDAILESEGRPALVQASGSNYYGAVRQGELDESAASGDGFLAEVCRQWEGASQGLADAGVRTVQVRTGMVLSAKGGALAKMLPAFKAGLGGRVGSGRQQVSWIGLPDLVRIYLLAIEDCSLSGPLNAVSPEPVSNQRFAEVLAGVLGRPSALPVPGFMVKALFGEMAAETVLADLRLKPAKLQSVGFEWKSPSLQSALEAELNDTDR
ncbi:TIGR01777 family oxidoreductase [Coraliomargarita parva]|uniref:TIGR01777 family oxidoreductase n=1 Tax=Coraliomargarita parva TaxID=3014050 RepID=UPI0022B5DAB6|nr:TIGR01777 family oxidoreductase [Coraliomargarita parva]